MRAPAALRNRGARGRHIDQAEAAARRGRAGHGAGRAGVVRDPVSPAGPEHLPVGRPRGRPGRAAVPRPGAPELVHLPAVRGRRVRAPGRAAPGRGPGGVGAGVGRGPGLVGPDHAGAGRLLAARPGGAGPAAGRRRGRQPAAGAGVPHALPGPGQPVPARARADRRPPGRVRAGRRDRRRAGRRGEADARHLRGVLPAGPADQGGRRRCRHLRRLRAGRLPHRPGRFAPVLDAPVLRRQARLRALHQQPVPVRRGQPDRRRGRSPAGVVPGPAAHGRRRRAGHRGRPGPPR